MASTATDTLPEPDAFLSESWATLSNSDYSREDDLRSESTDIGSLVSNNGTEDAHSANDDDNSEAEEDPRLSSTDEDHLQRSDDFAQQELRAQGSKSVLMDTPTMMSTHSNFIVFDEPESWPEVGHADLKHIVEIFDKAETHQILESIYPVPTEPAELVGTIHMIMSGRMLEMNRPFRLLYTGLREARQNILEKVADALVAGPDASSGFGQGESSRYSVIPSRFGPSADADFADLIPIRTQIVVDEVKSASFHCHGDTNEEHLEVTFKNGSVYHSRPKALCNWEISSTSPWHSPDVAILFVSEGDTSVMRETLQSVLYFVLRHRIPSLIISDKAFWADPLNGLLLSYEGLSMCVESRSPDTQASLVLRRLPIDLATFDSLDSKQLNKHLACLVENAQSHQPAFSSREPSATQSRPLTSYAEDSKKRVSKNARVKKAPLRGYDVLLKQLLKVALCAVVSVLLAFVCKAGILSISSYLNTQGDLVAPSVVLESPSCGIPQVQSSVFSSQTPVAAVSTANSLTTVPQGHSPALFAQPAAELLVNNSDKFQVEVIGDCHMIIKAPAKLKVKRRVPSFKVSVTRGTELLENLSLSKLFDGVYSVKLDRQDAYGLLNVTITLAKAGINEVHEVDFGTPWLKATSWKTVAARVHEDLGIAQSALVATIQKIRINMQTAAWLNSSNSLEPLYERIARQTEVFSQRARAASEAATGRIWTSTDAIRNTSAKRREIARTAIAENMLLLQNTIHESSLSLRSKADNLRRSVLDTVARAQMRAKQAAVDSRRRKALRIEAKEGVCKRSGRKGGRSNS